MENMTQPQKELTWADIDARANGYTGSASLPEPTFEPEPQESQAEKLTRLGQQVSASQRPQVNGPTNYFTPEISAKLAKRYPVTAEMLGNSQMMALFGTPEGARALTDIEAAIDRKIGVGHFWERGELLTHMNVYRGELSRTGGFLSPEEYAQGLEYFEGLKEQLAQMPEAPGVRLSPEEKDRYRFPFRGVDGVAPGRDHLGPYVAELYKTLEAGDIEGIGYKLAETAGQLKGIITHPNTAVGAAGGALVGAPAGGVGAVPGAVFGGVAGMSLTAYDAAVGASADFLDEQGVTGGARALAEFFIGSTSSLLEIGQVGLLAKPAGELVKTVAKGLTGDVAEEIAEGVAKEAVEEIAEETAKGMTAREILPRFVKNVVAGMAAETGMEVSQDTLAMAGENLGAKLSNLFDGNDAELHGVEDFVENAWETFKFMATGGGLIGAGGAFVQAASDTGAVVKGGIKDGAKKVINWEARRQLEQKQRAADRAKTQNQLVETEVRTLATTIRENETLQANPEVAKAVTGKVLKDKGDEGTFYLDAAVVERFRQEALDDDTVKDGYDFEDNFLNPLGVTLEVYQQSLEMGTSLPVNKSNLAGVVNSQVWQKIEATDGAILAEPASVTAEREAEVAQAEAAYDDPFAGYEPEKRVSAENKEVLAQSIAEKAGQDKSKARNSAELLGRAIARPLAALGIDPNLWLENGNLDIRREGEPRPRPEERLNQPMNADVDLDKEVTVVEANTAFAHRQLHELNKGDGRRELRAAIVGVYRNKERGWDIEINTNGIDHAISSASHSSNSQAHLVAVASLPSLIENAVLIETHSDKKGKSNTLTVHRFYAPLTHDGTVYVTKLTVKEDIDGRREASIESVTELTDKKLYDVNIEKEMPVGIRQRHTSQLGADSTTGNSLNESEGMRHDPSNELALGSATDTLNISIRELLEGVKGSDKKTFFQGTRGALERLKDGRYTMIFGGQADASTAIHESAHLFLSMALDVLATPLDQIKDMDAYNKLKADIEILAEWAGVGSDGVWTVEAHEKFARGFELYLMEGRAPSKNLKGLFSRFKSWLIDIYKDAKRLNVELSDDVRGVMDRIITTETELQYEATFDEPYSADMAPEVASELAAAREQAQAAREEAITKMRVKEVRALEKEWQAEGKELADMNPIHQIMDDVVRRGGFNRQSLTGYSKDDIARLAKTRVGLVTNKGRVSLDGEALDRGYDDADALWQDLFETPTKQDIVAHHVAASKAENAELLNLNRPWTEAEVDYLILRQAVKDSETNAKEGMRVLKEVRAELNKKQGSRIFKDSIARSVGLTPVDELAAEDLRDLHASLRAQQRASKEGAKEGAREEREKTSERYKEKQKAKDDEYKAKMAKMAATYKEKAAAKDYITKSLAKIKRFLKQVAASPTAINAGGVAPEYAAQAKQLLQEVGIEIGKRGDLETQRIPTLLSFVNAKKAEGETVYVADWILAGQWPKTKDGRNKKLTSLTFDQLQDVMDTFDSLLYLGREDQRLLAAGNRKTLNEAATDIITSIDGHGLKDVKPDGPGPADPISSSIKKFLAKLRKLEFLVAHLDGFQFQGKVYEYLFKPFVEAEKQEIILKEKIVAKLKEATDNLFTEAELYEMGTSPRREQLKRLSDHFGLNLPKSLMTERHAITGAPHLLTVGEMMVVVLNSRSSLNLRNLLEGNHFTEQAIAEIESRLTPNQMAYVEAVWSALEELGPKLAETHFQATGARLPMVDGRYYPIFIDAKNNPDAVAQIQDTDARQFSSRQSSRAGATHERTGAINPIDLDINRLSSQIEEVIHDVTHRAAVRDVNRLIRRPDVRSMIIQKLGMEKYQAMIDAVNWIARPKEVTNKSLALSTMNYVRRNMVFAYLAFNLNTAVMQTMGFFQSAAHIGTSAMVGGLMDFAKNPRDIIAFVDELSPAVRERSRGFDQDMRDVLGQGSKTGLDRGMVAKIQEVGFWPIKIMDMFVVYPTWYGAYNKAIREGQGHEKAVESADTAVRLTQPVAAAKDTAGVQRTVLGKTLAPFFTFFSAMENYNALHIEGARQGKVKKRELARILFISALLPSLLNAIWRGEELPEEPEDFLQIGKETLLYLAAGYPVIRDFLGLASGENYRTPILPVHKAIEAAGWVFGDAASGDVDSSTFRNAISTAGYIAPGVPAGALNKAIRWFESDSENLLRIVKPEPRD